MENLEGRSRRLRDEILSKARGAALVPLDLLSFNLQESLDPKNVNRLIRIFRLEGCDHLNPRHALPVNVSMEMLDTCLAYSNLSLSDLASSKAPQLHLPPGSRIQCLHGKHRVAAFRRLRCSQNWWRVELYVGKLFEMPE